MMSRTGEIQEVPQKFDEEGNPIIVEEGSKTGASNAPTLEDLLKRLEKLMTENNKLRRKIKAKRAKGGSSSSKEEDFSNEEDVSKKGRKDETIAISFPITQYLSIMIICLALPLTLPYSLVKLPTPRLKCLKANSIVSSCTMMKCLMRCSID
jgi:hypothetical protein